MRVDGSLGYTQAHSASVPTGAYLGGFINVTVSSDCAEDVNVFTWKDPEGSSGVFSSPFTPYSLLLARKSHLRHIEGILACPDLPYYMNGTATYQIYAKTPAFNLTDCVELEGLLPTYLPSGSPPGAWQYT